MKNTNSIAPSVFDRLFAHLTSAEKATFTPEQVDALQAASTQLTWKRHAVDIRISIPVPAHSGIYLVILAGSEQRSTHRIRAQRRFFWQLIGLIGGTAMLASLGCLGIIKLLPQISAARDTVPHPTILPWIETKTDCVGEGKVWQDGECWDIQHDPMF
jgi:hypothetical protein